MNPGSAILIAISLLGYASPLATAQEPDPSNAVFMVHITDRDPVFNSTTQEYRVHSYGFCTAFFIGAEGTAMTNSHCGARVVKDPDKYRMIAIVGTEWYDVQMICASHLPYDATTHPREVEFSKDVSEIKLIPSDAYAGKKTTFYYPIKELEMRPWATPHQGALPAFPFLVIDGHPQGDVRVVGFGQIGAIPEKWTARGVVEKFFRARDGTETFGIEMDNGRAQPGDSGAPVLNGQNRVVGLWTWHDTTKSNMGYAQSNSVLRNFCH
ncbi:MAG TPA: serine protease [bacterium]|nr:serine protease [bacterium]